MKSAPVTIRHEREIARPARRIAAGAVAVSDPVSLAVPALGVFFSRMHYAETLRRWDTAFLDNRDRVLELGFDETFITHKPSKNHDPEQDPHGVAGITDRAVDFIGRHRGRPFFLELAHNSIHAPIMAPKDLIAKHRTRPGSDRPENTPVIAAMMVRVARGLCPACAAAG